MSSWPAPRIMLLIVLLAFAAGTVVAVATDPGAADPAPARATRDRPGLVAIARPITPYAAGSPATGRMELRARIGKDAVGVLYHRFQRRQRGRLVRYVCFEVGPERALRRYRIADGGSCSPVDGPLAGGEPWAIAVSSAVNGPVIFSGVLTRRVRRLTVAGPGGTFVVPRSAHGAFAVAYGSRATGRMVLTATLTDGATRYYRSAVPPGLSHPGATITEDPGGLPDWSTAAYERRSGGHRGHTCLQVTQSTDLRRKDPRARGGSFLPPACGDLRRHPVFARTVALGPSRERSQFSPGGFAPRRTIVAGAVARGVQEVALLGPSGRRVLPLADAGRAFLAVLPARVTPAALTLEVTLADGRVARYLSPVALNGATSGRPTPTLAGRGVTLLRSPPGARRVVLRATLTHPAKRFEITFLGREAVMRRTGGPDSAPAYTGVYDGTRGVRGVRRGLRSIMGFSVLICGPANCAVRHDRAGLK